MEARRRDKFLLSFHQINKQTKDNLLFIDKNVLILYNNIVIN